MWNVIGSSNARGQRLLLVKARYWTGAQRVECSFIYK